MISDMTSYVELKKFFSSEEDRSIDMLGKIYEDMPLLQSSIKEVMMAHLKPEQIEGKTILLKPNLVKQCNPRKPYDPICLFTHPNFILATLRVLLECSPKAITVGDAPIQNCHWESMLHPDFYDKINRLQKEFDVPIRVVDFRKVIFYPDKNVFGRSNRKDEDYLVFDVANRSYLEPITKDKNVFRVTNYNPDRMAKSHAKGMHKFCVAKEVFDADIVITMPKTKTHRMACITNSLKVLVGINGDKDYLPHHRIGSERHGGDCYKDHSLCRSLSERLLDFSNRHQGKCYFGFVRKVASLLWKLSFPTPETSSNAGWYGNDTVWRMVLDLNTIALYGKADGTLSDTPQRTLYTLTDAIIGGQGSGPLEPDPLALGFISFSNDPYLNDEVFGRLFNLDVERVPLLYQASKKNKEAKCKLFLDGKEIDFHELENYSTQVTLAPGWVHYADR